MNVKGCTVFTDKSKYVIWLNDLPDSRCHARIRKSIYFLERESWWVDTTFDSTEEALNACYDAITQHGENIKKTSAMKKIQSGGTKKTHGETRFDFEFAEIFESELVVDDFSHFFALRDTYYEVVRNAIRHNKASYQQIIATCEREPIIEDAEIKAYAAATAKYYLHKFGICDGDIPQWIEDTPPCAYLTPFIINSTYLGDAARTCPPEFLEKNILVREKDFTIA